MLLPLPVLEASRPSIFSQDRGNGLFLHFTPSLQQGWYLATELLRKKMAARLLQGSQRWSLCRSFPSKKNRVRTGMGVTFGVPSFKVASSSSEKKSENSV